MDESWSRRWRGARPDRVRVGDDVGAATATGPAPPLMSRRGSIALLIISFIALIVASYSGVTGQAYARCQAGLNERSAIAQRARGDAAAQDRDADRAESTATRDLIVAVFSAAGPNARDEVRAAFARYETRMREIETTRQEAEQRRQQNPLPPLPSETCG